MLRFKPLPFPKESRDFRNRAVSRYGAETTTKYTSGPGRTCHPGRKGGHLASRYKVRVMLKDTGNPYIAFLTFTLC